MKIKCHRVHKQTAKRRQDWRGEKTEKGAETVWTAFTCRGCPTAEYCRMQLSWKLLRESHLLTGQNPWQNYTSSYGSAQITDFLFYFHWATQLGSKSINMGFTEQSSTYTGKEARLCYQQFSLLWPKTKAGQGGAGTHNYTRQPQLIYNTWHRVEVYN